MDSQQKVKWLLIAAVGTGAILVAVNLNKRPIQTEAPDPQSTTESEYESSNDPATRVVVEGLSDSPTSETEGGVPDELVSDIHSLNRDYLDRAQAAAENMVAEYDPNGYLRWRPVYLNVDRFLTQDYRLSDAVPRQVRLTPFPDTTFLVTETSYSVDESIESALWEGRIEGSDSGRVEITVLAMLDSPQLIIRVFNSPQHIAISPTNTADGYVAVESNPHKDPPIN